MAELEKVFIGDPVIESVECKITGFSPEVGPDVVLEAAYCLGCPVFGCELCGRPVDRITVTEKEPGTWVVTYDR